MRKAISFGILIYLVCQMVLRHGYKNPPESAYFIDLDTIPDTSIHQKPTDVQISKPRKRPNLSKAKEVENSQEDPNEDDKEEQP